ncbi:MAG: TIGR04282 family arsenosugar biosynthesis glycosyltransferase [Lewinellaceae bacterium]|nr:TIGR04282 family arsenosugar biosynthesis glycosyltransferase [Lewinellaceae bacterium]
MDSRSNILLIFIRNPRLGKVKTRLAQTLGDAEALRIYLTLLEKTRQAALGSAAQRWLFYSDAVASGDGWPESDFEKLVQHGGDLGARMADAFRRAFAAGAARVLIIGSDCPELTGALLDDAFAHLHHDDFVLGPTPDGGYYLLGMRAFEPSVFEEIAWSTDSVRTATLEKIRVLGKTCTLLPELSDVDTEADWRKLEGRI